MVTVCIKTRSIDVPLKLENVFRLAGERDGLQLKGHPEKNLNVFTTAVNTKFGLTVQELMEQVTLKRLAIEAVGNNSVFHAVGDGEHIAIAIRKLDAFP